MLNKLDTALMYELKVLDCFTRKETKLQSLDVCQGIVMSAFWLDLISKEEYLTISRILDEKRLRIQYD
jgi:hypothetical protein